MKNLMHPQTPAGYCLMIWTFRLMDLFHSPEKRLDDFGIKKGDIVIDYGCGPGRYIRRASQLAGPDGRVYAADINPMAIDIVRKRISKHKLDNVIPVLLGNDRQKIPDHSADIIYALDMFHQITDPAPLLADMNRMVKQGGLLFLEDGHQSRNQTAEKIRQSDFWQIAWETRSHVTLTPTEKSI